MARTRSKEYPSIRSGILDKSATLFAKRGYAATSIGEIAEANACSKSRLYHYFDGKESILVDMLQEHVDNLLEGSRLVIEQHDDPEARFAALIAFYLEVYAHSGDKHVVLMTCMGFLPEDVRKDVLSKERALVSHVKDTLKAIRPDLADRTKHLHVDTMLFFGMINWTYTWYQKDGVVDASALADRVVALFLEGYKNAQWPPSRKKAARVKARAR